MLRESRVGRHPFHLVAPSAWPFIIGMSLFPLLSWVVDYLHGYSLEEESLSIWFVVIVFIFSIIKWFQDIVTEATFLGYHTVAVIKGLRYGMLLFIISEVMLFFSLFWAYLHCSVSPSIWIGCVWPPLGIKPINPWHLPFLNTVILLSSGVAVTWAHRAIVESEPKWWWYKTKEINDDFGRREQSLVALALAIAYGVLFTLIQLYEYNHTNFNISDGIYGATFFLLTGFHGFHVLVGTVFLIVCFIRHYYYHFTEEYHFGLEAGIWYWHFVDVVWLLLFVLVYWWGSYSV